jgi:hypothetical protein
MMWVMSTSRAKTEEKGGFRFTVIGALIPHDPKEAAKQLQAVYDAELAKKDVHFNGVGVRVAKVLGIGYATLQRWLLRLEEAKCPVNTGRDACQAKHAAAKPVKRSTKRSRAA